MRRTTTVSVTRLHELQQQIELLANLRPGATPVVSCYLDLTQGTDRLERFVEHQLAAHAGQMPFHHHRALLSCIGLIRAELAGDLPQQTRGLALFIATDGAAPLLAALPFAMPFGNMVTVSASPDLLPLLRLKAMYGWFMIVLARRDGLQVAEVDLGDVSVRAWAANPWKPATGTDPASPRRTIPVTLQDQVRLIERFIHRGGRCPLFLAGDKAVMQGIHELLRPATVSRLLGVLPAPAEQALPETVAACQQALIAFESGEARALSARALHHVRHHGLAVAGVAASLDALRHGAVETLLVAGDCHPEPGWSCAECGATGASRRPPAPCPVCDGNVPRSADRRVELIRLAGQSRVRVEFSDDDALAYPGGVACLLRSRPQAQAHPCPAAHHGGLDLVA